MPANDARPMASSTDTQSQPDASALPGGNTPASFSNDAFTYSFGAQPRSGGLTQFRLWAPAQKAITLEVEGHPPLPMSRRDDGFHEAQTSCVCEARYRYRINPDLAIPDPASRLQAGDVHDASVVVGSGNYTWRHPDWAGRPWCDTVLYEVHPGVAGGFTGIQQRLAGLAELGITAIELMPVADFSGARNWGYDGVLPYAPDTTYGTPEQLKALIDTAHGLNLMVFLDVVYNHFGPEGNYQGLLAPEFFRTDRHTPWGPAIDFRKPQVRRFFAENALYWLNEYRFDGLRLDAVHAISELDWLPEMAHFVRQHVDPKRHVHLVLENDNNAAHLLENGFEAQWNDDIHHVLHHLLTGETQGYYMDYAVQPAQKLARALAEGFVYQGQPMNWRNGAARGESSGHLPSTAFVFFLQNHDQTGNRAFGERLISLVGSNVSALRAAIALQLLSPQIPLIFMGEECGATVPFLYFTGYQNHQLAQAVRNGRCQEFSRFEAFSDPQAQESIPDPNSPDTFAALAKTLECTGDVSRHWQAWYRELLAVRHRFITPQLARVHSLGAQVAGPAAVAAQWRLANNAVLTLYSNLAQDGVKAPTLMGQYAGCDAVRAPTVLFESAPGAFMAMQAGSLWPACTIATLSLPKQAETGHG